MTGSKTGTNFVAVPGKHWHITMHGSTGFVIVRAARGTVNHLGGKMITTKLSDKRQEIYSITFNERDLIDFVRARDIEVGRGTSIVVRVRQGQHVDKIILNRPKELEQFQLHITVEREK